MRMNISVPDELAAQVRDLELPISAICQNALRAEVENLAAIGEGVTMRQITVETGEPIMRQRFTGQWLVEPDRDKARSENALYRSLYWGVALTRRGRFAVYRAHRDGREPARLDDYDTLDQAKAEHTPADIIARAATALGETRILWRDI
jgi:hypothetical protein